MINLKKAIKDHPECLENANVLKGYLLDLYPKEKVMINILVGIFVSDFFDDLKQEKISDSFVDRCCKSLEKKNGFSIRMTNDAIHLWHQALIVSPAFSSTSTSIIVNNTNPQNGFQSTKKAATQNDKRIKKILLIGSVSLALVLSGFFAVHFFVKSNQDLPNINTPSTVIEESEHHHLFADTFSFDDDCHYFECSCGEKSEIKMHNFNETIILSPTQNTPGKKTLTCTVCGFIINKSIPELSHAHSFPEIWKTTTTVHYHQCKCGEQLDKSVHTFGNWKTEIEATCTKTGKKINTCTVCGYQISESIPTSAHSFSSYKTTKEPAMTKPGEQQRVCKVCGFIDKKVIPELSHKHTFSSQWIATDSQHYHQCECGEQSDKSAHTFGNWKTEIEATCIKPGKKIKACTVCGYQIFESIPTSAHLFSSYKTTKESTMTEAGEQQRKCNICGLVEKKSTPSIIKYELLSDGTYSISGFSEGQTVSNLNIPKKISNISVTAISSNAFSNSSICSLVLPNSITTIKDNAFSHCSKLESINLSKNLRYLSATAFNDCSKLTIPIDSNISNNTNIHRTDKIYTLTGDVQIKNGVTLNVSAGVIIFGHNYAINNFGAFVANGTTSNPIRIFNTDINSRNSGNSPNTFDLNNMHLFSGNFSQPTGNSQHSYISINNCKFYDAMDYTHIWYPETCTIKNSYFDNWGVLSIGTHNSATIEGNTFINCGTERYDDSYHSVICCWASYGEPIVVKNNKFISPKKYALALRSDSSNIDAIGNDFGTTDSKKIQDLIYDGNDNYEIPNTIKIK